MKTIRATLLMTLLAGLTACVTALAADVLTTKDGRTVYVFDKDSAGKSVCKDACAAKWPAVTPDMMQGGVEAIARDDGGKQATLNGKPLYLFAGDQKAGDKAGDGVNGVWHVVPAGRRASSAPAPASTSSSPSYTY